jgi:hypothetical protein
MRADDDGFISNPKRIIKMVGSSDDDMKVLLGKQYIIPFESGVCVVKHWKIHNYIQKDRYQETECIEEKNKLTEVNNKYEKDECIQNVSKLDTQVRIGKVRKGKNIDTLFEKFWNNYPKKVGKPAAEKALNKLKPTESLLEEIIKGINRYKNTDQWRKNKGEFIPYPATFLNQRRWEDEIQEREKKPYYRGDPIVEKNGKRYVITPSRDWLEFAGRNDEIEYK